MALRYFSFATRLQLLRRSIKWRSLSTTVARESADAVIIGAGVVGLAVARQLAMVGHDVLVLESGPTFGTATSSRNSEVIHAGIYYPPGSLQATLCVSGRRLLYNYCSERGIPHNQMGKLIVATSNAEIPKLQLLLEHGIKNGVEGLRMVESSEAMKMEPELFVSKHCFLHILGEAESSGATVSYNTTVIGGHIENNCINLHITESKELVYHDGNSPLPPQLIVSPKLVINSAGLGALPLAKRFCGVKSNVFPNSHYARGCYFTLSKTRNPPFSRLIYPMPEDGCLGVHVTLDLNGQVKFGPDVEWIGGVDDISCFLNRFDYSVNPDRAIRFYSSIRKYYPNLMDDSLEPGYSGMRPKLSGPGQPQLDFIIQGEDVHGVPGLINLLGIESPGLTSCLAMAEYVVSRFTR